MIDIASPVFLGLRLCLYLSESLMSLLSTLIIITIKQEVLLEVEG